MGIFTYSKYAEDKETRIIAGGCIIFLLGITILGKSKAQKSVTLSSAEAEFVALSEAAKEFKSVMQVLETIGIKLKLPIIIRAETSSCMRFIKSKANIADGFIKNITGNLYNSHMKELVAEHEDIKAL
jgi:hypothetical protein